MSTRNMKHKGLEDILHTPPLQRTFPLLEELFKRFSRLMASELRKMITCETLSVVYKKVSSAHLIQAMGSEESQVVAQLSLCDQKENLFFAADKHVLFRLVKMMLGKQEGPTAKTQESVDKSKSPVVADKLTPIETHLATTAFSLFTEMLTESAHVMDLGGFSFDYMSSSSADDFSSIPLPCAVGHFLIHLDDVSAPFSVVFPYTTYQAFTRQSAQEVRAQVKDALWVRHAQQHVEEAGVALEMVLSERMLPLHDILKWHAGYTLPLNVTAESLVSMRCEGTEVGLGKMGQKEGIIALSIEYMHAKERQKS